MRLADFVAKLAPINALADGSPGFVWRLQTEDGDATAIRVFDDDRLIVNMSVWTSFEALADFVYRSAHVEVMRRRREWFHSMAELFMTLWWIPAGTIPTLDEAEERLLHLRTHGPTPRAFTFRDPFPPGELTQSRVMPGIVGSTAMASRISSTTTSRSRSSTRLNRTQLRPTLTEPNRSAYSSTR